VHSGTDKTYFWSAWRLDFLVSSRLGGIVPSPPPWIRPWAYSVMSWSPGSRTWRRPPKHVPQPICSWLTWLTELTWPPTAKYVKSQYVVSKFFSVRVVQLWNNLPEEVVSAFCVSAFKSLLNSMRVSFFNDVF